VTDPDPYAYRVGGTVANWAVVVAFAVSFVITFVTREPMTPYASDDPAVHASLYGFALVVALAPAIALFVHARGSDGPRRRRRRRPVGLVVSVLVAVGSLAITGPLLVSSLTEPGSA